MSYIDLEVSQGTVHKKKIRLESCISKLRKKCGLTQKDLADHLGLTESTIANWETGRSILEKLYQFQQLCEILKCDFEDLFSVQSKEEVDEDPYISVLKQMGTLPNDKNSVYKAEDPDRSD